MNLKCVLKGLEVEKCYATKQVEVKIWVDDMNL